MPDKKYYVYIPGTTEPAVLSTEDYEAKKDKLHTAYKDANVVEMQDYNKNEDVGDSDFFVNIPGSTEPTQISAKDFAEKKDKIYAAYPDVQVSRIRPVNYWGDKLGEIYDKIDALKAEQAAIPGSEEEEMSRDEDGNLVITTRSQKPGLRRRLAIRRELNQLYKMRDENPQWQQYWENERKDIDDSLSRVRRLTDEDKAVRQGPSSLDRALSAFDEDYLRVAERYYQDAKKAAEAPSKFDDSNGFANFWQGAKDTGWTALSLVDLAQQLDNVNLLESVKKIQENEGDNVNVLDLVKNHPDKLTYMSESEKEMMRAFVRKAEVESGRSDDLSRMYQAGQGAAKSLGFMLDFYAAGGAVGEKVADKLVGGAVKAAGRNTLARLGAETLYGLTKAVVMTPLMPSSYSNYINNLMQFNDAGGIDLSGKALARAGGDVLIENISETIGSKPMDIIGLPLSKVEFGSWAKAMRHSPFAQGLKQAGYNGFFEEIVEEWTGNALRVLTGVDKDALKDFATIDQQLITAASFAPMSIFGGGVSAYQLRKSSKAMKSDSDQLEAIINALPEQADKETLIKGLRVAKEDDTPEHFAHVMSQIYETIVDGGGDAAKALEAVMRYTESASQYKVIEGVFEEQKDIDRIRQLVELDNQMGNVTWHHYGKNDASFVRTITDEQGIERFVCAKGDGELVLVDREGNMTFLSEQALADGIEAGTLKDSGEVYLNDFLDQQTQAQKQQEEQVRMQTEAQAANAEFISKTQPGMQVNLGTVEKPQMGTILQNIGGRIIVEKPDGSTQDYAPEEIANKLGIRTTPETDAEIEAKEETQDEQRDTLRQDVNSRRGQPFTWTDGNNYTLVGVTGSEGPMPFSVYAKDVNGKDLLIPMTDEQMSAFSSMLQQSQPTVEEPVRQEEPAQETVEVADNVPRDFRGNPLPMRTNKQTGQQVVADTTLWNEDPEAWAKWNDTNPNQIVSSKERLDYAVKQLNKEIDKDTNSIKKAALQGIDDDEMDNMQEALGKKVNRRDLLSSILNQYNLPVTAGETFAGEKRKEQAEQVKQEQRAGFPGIQQRWNAAPKVQGMADEIRLPNGETVTGSYVLTEAGAPTPSHNPASGFVKSEGFPVDEKGKTVNDRDYERDKAAQDAVLEKAANYDQRALQTPVIVSADGVVLSGNDRTMASHIAAANNTDAAYTGYLAKYSQKYGFTPQQVAQFQHPRVVFVPDVAMPYNAATFAKFNAEEKKSQNKAEKAGKTLTPEALASLATLVDQYDDINALYNDPVGVNDLIKVLLAAEVISPEQVAALRDGDSLSGAGMDLLESTLIGAALDEEAVRVAMNDKAIRKAVVSAISQILTGNTLEGYTLRSELTDAIALVAAGKDAGEVKFGESVQYYVRQQHLFMEDVVAEATVQMLADAVNNRKTSFLKKVLSLYNRDAADSAMGQMNLFTDDVPTREAIIRNILEYLGYDTRITYDTSAREAEQRAAAEQRADETAETEQNGAPVQSDAGGRVNQFDRERAAVLLEQGNVGELADYLTDDEIAEFLRLYDLFQPANDALGEAYSRLADDLKSKDKKVKKEAQDEINKLEAAQEVAFQPVNEYTQSLIEKYGLEDEFGMQQGEELEEEVVEDEIQEEIEEESKPSKGKKSAKKGKKGKKSTQKAAEEKPLFAGNTSAEALSAVEYTQEEVEQVVYGGSMFCDYNSKKTGETIEIIYADDQNPIYHDNQIRFWIWKGGEKGKYGDTRREGVATTDYIMRYFKVNGFRQKKATAKKNQYGFWVNDSNVIINPIRIRLASTHKGWVNFQHVELGRCTDGKWSLGKSFATPTGSIGYPVSNDGKYDRFDSKSDAIRKAISDAESYLKNNFKEGKSKSYEQRDLENLIRTLKTQTLPQALIEEGANVPSPAITPVTFGEQGTLFDMAAEETTVEKPKRKRTAKKTQKPVAEAGTVVPEDEEETEIGEAADEIIVFPGEDAAGSVPKIALKERDGKWYWATYVPTDGGKGSAWGSQVPKVQTHALGEPTREDALKKAIHYIRFIIDTGKPKVSRNGETFNEANQLIDYVVKTQLPQAEAKEPETPAYGSQNTIITTDKYEELKRRMKEKLGQLNAGFDPEVFFIGAQMAAYHVEAGARKFIDFSKRMINDLGDAIRPYLKAIYNGARDLPGMESFKKDMDLAAEVDAIDVEAINLEEPAAEEEPVQEEAPAEPVVTVREVDVNGLMGDVSDMYAGKRGEVKLSEFAQPVEVQPEPEQSSEGEKEKPIGPSENTVQLGEIGKYTHTKTGREMTIVRLTGDRLSSDEFKALKKRAKELGGYYSSYGNAKGFLFDNEEDAIKFNTIETTENVEEQTDEQTAADTAAIVDKGASVASEAESLAEAETPVEPARAAEVVEQIDQTLDAINDQLALLGYYKADEDVPFHESYGYMKSAEKKAVKDADKLAKKLATDLGIEVGRKQLAKANIAPAGGDITFRLPLNEGRELYVDISMVLGDKDADDLQVSNDISGLDIMYRVEQPSATGLDKYGPNLWTPYNVPYKDLLRGIRNAARDYLPEPPAPGIVDPLQVAKEQAEKNRKSGKKTVSSQKDGDEAMGGLFATLFDTLPQPEPDAEETQTPEESVKPTEVNGFTKGEKVLYTPSQGNREPQEATIYDFEYDGRPVLDAGLAPVRYEIVDWEQIKKIENEPVNDTSDGLPRNDDVRTGGLQADDSGQRSGVSESEGRAGEETGQEGGRTDGGREGGSQQDLHGQQRTLRPRYDDSVKRNTHNNRISKGEVVYPKTNAARFKANIAAIRLLKELQDSGKQATKEQMAVLRQYTGWGGLGGYFNKEYSPEYKELKSLLTDEEMQAAALSINTAYYTPVEVIDAMWDIAKRLGFEGGNVLEGSAGIGNILASMPKGISEHSEITAVELDNITGGILELLYPDASVLVKGFEEADIPNNSVDLAITNVPFGNINVYDSKEKDISRKFGGKVHDFCIAKNIRKLAEGGIGIFISTRGTLDNSSKALRQWIVNEGGADVIGAFRLNNETFEGTGATSDIIVVRKRVNGQVSPNAIDISSTDITRRETFDTGETQWNRETRKWEPITGEAIMEINTYFVEHPENMGGEMGFGYEHKDTYRPGSSALWPSEKIDQQKRLNKWVKQFSDMQQEAQAIRTASEAAEAEESNATKEGQLVTNSKGEICVSRRGKAIPIGVNAQKVKGYTKAQVLSDYDTLKAAINEALDYQLKNESDDGLKPLLTKLNKAYDTFARKYGRLNKNTAISFLRNDVDFPAIAAVEDYKETKDINGKVTVTVKKTGIFNGRVLGVKRVPTPTSEKDGVIVSLNQFGRIDLPFIAGALGKDEQAVKDEIISSGLGFENPQTGGVEVEYEYLSGNVREKLDYAREHNTDGRYDANIKALEKVIPAEIPVHLIEFSLGSDWLPVSLYTDYAKERFGLNDKFVPQSFGGNWSVAEEPYFYDGNNEKNRSAGVTSNSLDITRSGDELMLAAMNKSTVQFSRTYKDFDGTTHTEYDKEAAQAAANKIDEMRDDFKEWCRAKILADEKLTESITKTYNDTFNAIVPKNIRDTFVPEHFEGQVLEMGGKPFHLRLHQAKAVIRATTEPLMMAHEVGSGKTFTLISTAMEMRRLGTAKKPMIVVQNSTLGQFVSSAKELYPNAKVLTISENERTAEGRIAFYAKVKYNDWDMIVVPQSVFEMIPDSEERQRAFIQDKIDEKKFILQQAKDAGNKDVTRRLEEELADLEYERDHNGEKRPKGKKKKDTKREAEAIENAAVRAKKQLDRKTDDVSDFDDMGIDALLVDEAHAYKHLGFTTSMQRGVKGVDPSYSKKSASVFLKTRAVFDKVGWKNVVFATGTPISNTAAEIWTFMKYLMPSDVMKGLHIYYFDDFVSNFGNISQSLEFTTSGKFKENARFASYTNLPELIRIWSSVTDTVLAKDAVAEGGEKLEDKQPKMENWTDEEGKEHINQARDIYLPQSEALVDIMTAIRAKLEWYENLSGKEKKENSYIPLTMFGLAKMAAIDPRLVDKNAKDEPLSKTNRVVEETLKALKDSQRYKGTAAIFCDNFRRWDSDASGKRVEGFNIFEEIKRKLVDAGVPADQIVIMKSGMTTAAKEKIFQRVNDGDVRVIMGTTATLGTGVNIQERLFFEAHVDAPNRPMDYTQRMGRILRQGNLHKDWGIPVRVVRFGVEDSLDVTAYQRLATKSKFINSIMDGKPLIANGMENRVLEEDEEGEFDNPVAILSGSQYALLKSQAERELRKLRNKKEQHRQDQIYIERKLKENESYIQYNNKSIKEAESNLAKVNAAFPEGEVKSIAIDGKKVKGAEQIAETLKDKITGPIRTEIERRRNDRGFTAEDLLYKMTFDDTTVTITVRLTRSQEWNDRSRELKTIMRTLVEYSCPSLGVNNKLIPGGYINIKDVITDFADRIASGRYFEDAIGSLKTKNARLESDNDLMRQRRGKPFEDEDKLKKQEEIVADYTQKMKAEMAEKEAKYAEMAKNASTNFSLDDVDIEDEAEGEDAVHNKETEEGAPRLDTGNPFVVAEATTAVNRLAQRLGIYVKFINDPAGREKGSYREGAHFVTINLAACESVDDAVEVLLHEGVAHFGLRELLGEDGMKEFIEKVLNNAAPSILRKIDELAVENGWTREYAAEEYIAELAEKTDYTRSERSFWRKVVEFVRNAIDFVTGRQNRITDATIRELLIASYENLSYGPITLDNETEVEYVQRAIRDYYAQGYANLTSTEVTVVPWKRDDPAGKYERSTDNITIFAINGRPYQEYETTLFHENLHAFIHKVGYDGDTRLIKDFIEFVRTADSAKVEKLEQEVNESPRYTGKDKVEEVFVRLVARLMRNGINAEDFETLPRAPKGFISNYLNAIGYGIDRETERGTEPGILRRRADYDRRIRLRNIRGEQEALREAGFEGVVHHKLRTKPAPEKTGIGYKVFYRGRDGKLYPPMVANPGGEDTPVGVWLDADAAPIAGESKTGRPQVKAGGKGTQGGSGTLAYRPGWHLGEIPYAIQFNRLNPATGQKDLFPRDFVWAEVEYAADKDYQREANAEGMTDGGKYRHSYAGLKRVPEDGYYRYRTNPNPETDPWIITGSMKVNRILTDEEVDDIVRAAGREPQLREADAEKVRKIAVDLFDRYENQNGEEKPWLSEAEFIDLVERELPRNSETAPLFDMIDQYRSLSEEDFNEGRRDYAGGEMTDLFNDLLSSLQSYADGVPVRDRVAGVEGFISNAAAAVNAIRQEKATPEQEGDIYTPSPVSFSESIGAKRYAATQAANKCGIEIEFKPSSEMRFKGKPLAGRWINGRMLVCLEHCRDEADAVRTVLHEGVGHNGLRRLVGNENMREFCLDMFNRLPDEARKAIANAAVTQYGGNISETVEEYLARQAEVMDLDNGRSFWDIVVDGIRNMLRKIGINIPLSERDVRWLMWQSYNANKQDDILNLAKRQVVADKLGFTLKQQAEHMDAVQLTRNRIAEEELAPAARIYNKDVMNWMNRLHETWVDKDDSVHLLVKAIETATGKKAAAFEDVRLALNQQSSKGLAAIEKFEREQYDPMKEAVKDLMKEKGIDLHAVERYVMIKHALERNEVFAKRDAREFYQDIHDRTVEAIESSDKIDDVTAQLLIAKEDAKLKKHLAAIEAGTDAKYKEFRNQDYGGLTAMYSEFDPIEPFQEGIESEEEYQARVLQARHPKYTYIDPNGQERVDMQATEQAAEQEIADFEKGSESKVDELWKRINSATKATLKHQYDANMMSRDQYLRVRDMFKYYVPLRGFADNTAQDMYDYYMTDQRRDFTPPLLKAKGRKTEAESPFGYIGAMASSGIAADMKNETKLALYYFISNRANNDLVTVSEVWYEKTGEDENGKSVFTPVYPPLNEDLSSEEAKQSYEDWEEGMKEKAKAGLAFKGRKKLNLHNAVIHIDKSQEASHIIKFKVGGRDMMMYINGNPRAAQAINNELNVEMSTDYQKVFGKILRWFSGINTSYNPEFWLSNAQRDALFALMSVNVKEDSQYNKEFRKNFGRLLRNTLTPGGKNGAFSLKRKMDSGNLGDAKLDNLYQEFVENGGVTGYTTLKNNEEWELELRKYTGEEKQVMQGIKTAFEYIQHYGEAIEQMTRFAAYMTSREQGKEIKDAINDAKELTVNFNRKGSGKAITFKEAERLRTKDGKKLNLAQKAFVVGASWLPVYGRRFIMFFNASVQGLNAMYKLFKNNPAKTGLWASGFLALGVLQALIHGMLDDDDDYLDIPDYERRNNVLMGGDGVYFTWALPQECRVFYGLGDMIVNHAMGREPNKSIAGELLASLSDIAPLNPSGGIAALAPSALTPIVEVALNRDYKGSKIYNDMQYLSDEEKKRTPAYQKAYQGTGKPYILISEFANWLTGGDYADAGWLNINPAAVEHILQGATGGAGTTLGKLYRGTVGQVLGEDFMVRNTPFLSRILTVTDDRYRNAHTTELFDYYKAEAEHTKKLIRAYQKNGDDKKLERILDGEDYEIMAIYESYRKLLEWYNNELKATTDKKERKALMREQDAVRKEMITEISNIGNND